MIRIRKGLDLPIAGEPRQSIDGAPAIRSVALLGSDYPGMRPALRVAEGDSVRRGQVLFEDRKQPGVVFTAPAAGQVSAIHRGEKRFMQSLVIRVDESGADSDQRFQAYSGGAPASLGRDQVRALLLESGEWTAIRTRPFGQVPAADSSPQAIFVTLTDTNPLAADPAVAVGEALDAFRNGLAVLSQLTDGTVWVCRGEGTALPSFAGGQVREETFAGPHPAGNAGTHIHFLHPVDRQRMVWTVGYQDVIAFGHLFSSGRLYSARVVALAGPRVRQPRLLRSRVGASVEDLCQGELLDGDNRIISGSVFNGHDARDSVAWQGRGCNQVTVLREAGERRLLGYLSPGLDRHSALNIYLSGLIPGKRFAPDTSTNGSERAMVPLGQYESVMPMDLLATQLLRSLVVGDMETAEALGALELVEEDLALCTYACVGKYEYGPILRDNLERIQKEG